MTSFERIRERKVVQWALAYLAGAWLVLQVVSTLGGVYDWPSAFMRAVPLVLGAGLAVTLVLAWYHGERGVQRVSGAELAILAALLAIAGLGVTLIGGDRAAGEAPAPGALARQPEAGGPPVGHASVAVLPFENMSSDPEQEFFSDGLTEELLNALAQIPGLRVAARTSSFAFKDKNIPVDSIAQTLRVAHLVEGSVRKVGLRVRIKAELIDAKSGYQVWSQTYDRELADIFAVQDEISRAIAEQLRINMVGSAPLVRQETEDPEAHALVLRGMAARRQGSEDAPFFRAAIRRDPEYARAHALLANSLMWKAYWRDSPREGYRDARVAAERALALDSGLSIAQVVRGRIADLYEWDFARADEHLRRALSINPADVDARSARAWLLMGLGQPEEAIREAQHAAELDPLAAAAHNTLGLMYFNARQPERALASYQAALAVVPAYEAPRENLAVTLSILGRHPEAIRLIERIRALEPKSPPLIPMGLVYARAGRRAEAEQALARLQAQPEASPFRLATIHTALGDRERALAMLERAVDEHDDNASWLAVTPLLDSVRDDPRFERLLRRGGLR